MNIAESAPKLDVNQRIPLQQYYRIADTLLRQAKIYRDERNIIELYIILLRFTSLVTETIPAHIEYRSSDDLNKELRKRVLEAVSELERLKPKVQVEWENRRRKMLNPPVASNVQNDISIKYDPIQNANKWQSNLTQTFSQLSLARPRDETVTRHSYFNFQQPKTKLQTLDHPVKVSYPSQIDFSLVEIPSLDQDFRSVSTPKPIIQDGPPFVSQYDLVNQLAPPPVLAPVKKVPSAVADPRPGPPQTSDGQGPKHVHVPVKMLQDFLALARQNTDRNLETGGVLAAKLEKGVFSITALIIPKQNSTSDSCETINEEELIAIHAKRDLFSVGWIHTHPTQTCFLSSIDLHTQLSYQLMLREAIAIVMAPTDEERSFGIFRLSEPGGMRTIGQCTEKGFHPHDEPEDGGSIYDHCSHVYMNPNLSFELIDLR